MNILFVGTPATPYGRRACDVKLASFANILAKKNSVCILNRYSPIADKCDISLSENIEIHEILQKKVGSSIWYFLLSILLEPIVIVRLNFLRKIDVIQIYSGHFFDFVIYWIVARLIGAKIIYQYDEFLIAKESRGGYFKWNSKLVDLVGPKLWDGAVCISDFLEKHAKTVNPKLMTMKLTPICDYSSFERIVPAGRRRYLLFCGSIGYFEVIEMILSSYYQSKVSKELDLLLVLSGDLARIERLKSENPDVVVLNGLQYDSLISLYKGADGLLIPLRNSVEDVARFPNKICEYLAAKGLVITTKHGEMLNYFIDGHNALVADSFSVEALVNRLDWLSDNYDKVDELKETAYNELYEVFNQYSNTDRVNDFISSLNNGIESH